MQYIYPHLIGVLEKKDKLRAGLVKQHLWFRHAWYTVQATIPTVMVRHANMPVPHALIE